MTFSPELQAAARRAQASPDAQERLAKAYFTNALARRTPALMRLKSDGDEFFESELLALGRVRMGELLDHMARGARSAYVSLVANRYAAGQTTGQLRFGKTSLGIVDFIQGLTSQKLALIDWLGDQDTPSREFAKLISEIETLYADIESAYAETYQSLLEEYLRVSAENAAIRDLNRIMEAHTSELTQRNAELHVMAEVSQAVTAADNLPQLLHKSLARLCDLLGAKYGAIWRWDDALSGLQIVAQKNFAPEEIVDINLGYRGRHSGALVLTAFHESRMIPIVDAKQDPEYAPFRHYAEHMDFRGTIYLPLLYQGKSTGVLSLYFQERREFPPEERRFLLSVSSQLAVAMQLAVYVEELRAARCQLETQVQERTRELQTEKAFLDRIVTHVPAAVALLDRDMVFQWANATYAEMIRVPLVQLVGHRIFDALPGSESQIGPLLRQVLDTGIPYKATSFPFTYLVDGEPRSTFWDFSYVSVEDSGVLLLAVEVSERVERERLQREKIADLTEADRLKDEFLSILSHELRTPLNAIMGFGSILDDELVGPLNEMQHTYLSRMLGGGDALLSLINDLLDMSRIQAGKFTLEPHTFPLHRVLQSVQDNLAPLAEKRQHTMTLEAPSDLPLVFADEQRVAQILINLVNNAIKFTPDGGTIRVTARREESEIRISVEDNGIGIAAEDMDKLFKPFSQLDMSDTRIAGGTGLGLSITKALVESHGGRLGVSSDLANGTCFWFTLPL